MEVMGLMLGQFVDDYTITCIDVFAMPQVKYTSTLEMLTYTARHGCKCRSRRPCISDEYVGYVEADGSPRDGGGVVSLSPWLRVLALWS